MLEEHLNFLLLNLHHLSEFLAEHKFPLVTQYEILQNVCGNFQLVAEKVGHFLWEDHTDEDSHLSELDRDSQLFKLTHLLLKIVPIELEVMHICYTNLKASTSAEIGRFIKQLLETSPDILQKYLIHLQEHMVTVTTPSTLGAQNIHFMIEFLLIILFDMPKDFIHHDKLFDLLAFVGALIREISTLVHDLEEKLRNKENVTYEAEDVIDSITVRDNGLLHLIFSLPITINKIKLIKEDISNLHEKILENRGLIVANSSKKPVESKSLTTDLDVISITGMPSLGKTTLAYKVYNDKSVSSHFDLCAWCTVDQEYDEKKLLDNFFNQVSDLDPKLSENIDVADMLRKQLYGKKYLIVIDDVWDTTTWDDLTRPFPTVEKGSRIILTTREMEVALHGKINTDPLNLRLLRAEESWELFLKRAFGKESCLDELLNVGKEIAQNRKGLPLVADLIAGVVARKSGGSRNFISWVLNYF
ncbi:hypothetical protein H5410_029533 [Solanum commersonii]|uniref:NB-ARC domain-containing protein n=1 Tax=Solanum commersonii TaxID=4109 RepID=A0A9J5YBS5_SOLCO|nr:hypothetical protein H5410_029533 [Solanum commersonii]